MRIERISLVGALAGIVLGGLVAVGCDGADDTVSAGDEAALHSGFQFHRRHRGADAGSAGGSVAGTTGGGSGVEGATGTTGRAPSTDCDVCTQAQQCCEAVAPGDPVCSFSAATCSSMDGDARPAYVNACLTFLVAARGAQANPPAECR
jgi:hypothetical protein